MKTKLRALRYFGKIFSRRVDRLAKNAEPDQQKIFRNITKKAEHTAFGRDHDFSKIKTIADFQSAVPIRGYEDLKPYFDRTAGGESNVLWPGRPKYLSKTSGTTSGIKYIPITQASLPNHIHTTRNALMHYANQRNDFSFFTGRVMFISGSPHLDQSAAIPTGRLSGIVNHEVPFWLKGNQLPSMKANSIEDWDEKIDAIIEETIDQDLRLIGGIPPWVHDYFERLLARTGKKTVLDVFPNLSLFVYGGVNYAPYKSAMNKIIGRPIDSLELYPASEGFIAFQDQLDSEDLLLNSNSGIFFEFIPVSEYGSERPKRCTISDVEIGEQYAVIINSNAGLWGYSIGDTVTFTSLNPYRLKVTGRLKHFISAYGEHVIGKEVETAMTHAMNVTGYHVNEFTVAPRIQGNGFDHSAHEWLVEFNDVPSNLDIFSQLLDTSLQEQNIYYKDLRAGNMLTKPILTVIQKNGFAEYMESIGKLGGQNKVPRLTNDRKIAEKLLAKKQ